MNSPLHNAQLKVHFDRQSHDESPVAVRWQYPPTENEYYTVLPRYSMFYCNTISSSRAHVNMRTEWTLNSLQMICDNYLCVYDSNIFGVRVWGFLYRNKRTCDLCCYLPTMGSRAALDIIRLSDRCLINASKSGLSIGAPLVADNIGTLEEFFISLKRDSEPTFQNTQCDAVITWSIFSSTP